MRAEFGDAAPAGTVTLGAASGRRAVGPRVRARVFSHVLAPGMGARRHGGAGAAGGSRALRPEAVTRRTRLGAGGAARAIRIRASRVARAPYPEGIRVRRELCVRLAA